MDYENVYYVTDTGGGRNANQPVVIERTRVPGRTHAITGPAGMNASVAWSPSGAVYQYPQTSYYSPTWLPASWTGYPLQPPYAVPPVTPPNNLANILGGFGDVGSLANIVAQVLAALLPLPAAPNPVDQTNNENDPARNAEMNSANLIRYQNALALFARRDQQILTLGSVLKELFKRPGVVTA